MAVHFGLFAELERQLRDALNAPEEFVPQMTKTQRRKIAKLGHRFQKAKPIARPDRTTVRLSCTVAIGTKAEVHEFSYYTPFAEEALKRAFTDLELLVGDKYKWITVLDNEKHT